MVSAEEIVAFEKTFENIVSELTVYEDADIQCASNWLRTVLQYNVPYGKKNRGLSCVIAFKHFLPKCTEEEMAKSRLVGWCVELLQAFFLLIDDIMDQSKTRRGKKCWYLANGVNTMAINDGLLICSSMFKLLKKHLRNHPCYIDILELFLDTCHNTEIGQCIDCLTMPEGSRPDFSLLTDKRYRAIAKYKTAYYTNDLPVRAAMYLAGIVDETIHKLAQKILLRIGNFIQTQDDYLDCYGDPEVTGKIGTDIEDGKCSWFAVVAIKHMSSDQRKIFEANYGFKDEFCVNKVKQIYQDLNMKEKFEEFEEKEYQEINEQIEEFDKMIKLDLKIFNVILDMVYKRRK